MIVLKRWIREFLSFFIFLRFKNIWNLYDYLFENKKISGIYASVFTHYCDKHTSYIGIGAEFKNHPYLPHGLSGIFISDNAKIGKNAVIFQNTTIGSSRTIGSKNNGSPTIGDNCYIGTGAVIIGNVIIGNNVRIGANATVNKDIPDNSIVVPTASRIITKDEALDNRFVKKVGDKYYYWDHNSNTFKELKNSIE